MIRTLSILAVVLVLATSAIRGQELRPRPMRAGEPVPSDGQFYSKADAARLLDLLRDRQSYRAEADARSREAMARTSEAVALRELVEVEKARREAAQDMATKANRAARGQRKRNWLAGLKGIFLGLTLGKLF